LPVRVERIGVPNVLVQHASQAAQRAQYGLSAENIAARVRALTPSQTA
jgi:transketolase C-terminal domain/subunit